MIRAVKLLAVLMLLAATSAHAGLLGTTMVSRWSYPVTGFDRSQTFIVNPGIEVPNGFGGQSTLDVSSLAIDVDMGLAGGLSAGVIWEFVDDALADMDTARVTTNFSGWDDAWLTLNGNTLRIEFAGDVSFPFRAGQLHVELVPEPASGLLLLPALAVLATGRRRQATAGAGRPIRT